MEFIEKDTTKGCYLIDAFLEKAWNEHENEYIYLNYDNFIYKNSAFKLVLLEEQKNLCSYCMRHINKDNLTCEHLIPQKLNKNEKQNELAYYLSVIGQWVVHKKDFDYNNKIIPPLKYPHDIAYHNLVASCDKCNNNRNDEPIKFWMYDSTIKLTTEYAPNGFLVNEQYQDCFDLVKLNSDFLKKIRCIWYFLASEFNSVDDVNGDSLEEYLYSMASNENIPFIEDFIGNKNNQKTILDYKYFFDYFKNKK
jgi:5-methylcytosine-specific restriction endonuclease McrA